MPNESINADVDRLLGNYEPAVSEMARQVRALILKLIPKAEEHVYFGWRIIRFSLNGEMSGQFIAIGPVRKHVNLYFMNGASLDDPKGLLEGTGKNMRHVKLKEAEQLKGAALKTLIKSAAKFQREMLAQ